jgi:hypothetical protein
MRGSASWDSALLAHLLDRIFPNLDLVSVIVRNSDEETKDDVGHIVRMFQAVREETRAVACGCSCHTHKSGVEEL